MPDSSSTMYTWTPEGSVIIFLIKTPLHTLVYIPSKDMMYYAHPSFALSAKCATHSVFISQSVMDKGDIPRLLVFDMARDGDRCLCETPSAERYQILQERAGGSLQQPQCVVQWVGELSAMDKTFTASLPHNVKSFMSLTGNPLQRASVASN